MVVFVHSFEHPGRQITTPEQKKKKSAPHRFVWAAVEGEERPQRVRFQEGELVSAKKFNHCRGSVVALRSLGLVEMKNQAPRNEAKDEGDCKLEG